MRVIFARKYLFICLLLTAQSAFSQTSLSGFYSGTITVENSTSNYDFTIQLNQAAGNLSGVTEIGNYNRGLRPSRISLSNSSYSLEGYVKSNSSTFTLDDLTVLDSHGNRDLFKKRYYVRSEETGDSMILYGKWENEGNNEFVHNLENYREYVLRKSNVNMKPGTFRVASLKVKCISGNCNTGFGIQQIQFGIYEGEFLNGQRSGKGKFTYTSSRLKGTVYIGNFAIDMFNGRGRIDYSKSGSAILWEEGTYINNALNGAGARLQRNGSLYTGTFTNGVIGGLMTLTNSGLAGKVSILGYWMDNNDRRAVPLNIITHHQDTTFARFAKCNCLEKKKFVLPSWEWTTEKYNEYNVFGDKVGESNQSDVKLSNPEFTGFMNNTDHDVYIRGYFLKYYRDRNVTEYEDGSYRLAPGDKAMGNYALPPQPGQTYLGYFTNKFAFLGQYCDQGTAPCKPITFNRNSISLTILSEMETVDKEIKKGSKVTITAKGLITVGMLAGKSSPAGIEGYESYNQVPGFKHGALLVRVGEKGKWRLAGSSVSFVAETSGKLQFLVNDADDSNNSGKYEIIVSLN